MFQLPFLTSATVAALILPTLAANVTTSLYMSDAEYLRFVCFMLVCLALARLGYALVVHVPRSPGKCEPRFPGQLLGVSLVPPMCLALLAQSQINPTEYGDIRGGSFAIFLFVARLLRPVQVLAFCGYALTKSRNCLLVFAICLSVTAPFILVSGRRSDTLFLPLSVLAPLWALNGVVVSRKQVILGVFFVVAVFFLLPVMRESTKNFSFEELYSISYSEELSRAIEGDRTNEVIEVAKDMDAVARTGEYSYGVRFINKFTFQYVSSTIFGQAVKDAFTLPEPNMGEVRNRASNSQLAYSESKNYLVRFGFGQAFLAFGWLGALYFFVFGIACGKFYNYCFIGNDPRRRMLYCVLLLFIPFSVYDSISGAIPMILPWWGLSYLCLYFVPKYLAKTRVARKGRKLARCPGSAVLPDGR
ncbi:hypothetical protein [Rhodopirellula islandica]|uniref:hypothetical protein n=1 Tax=Rhodopirellula islandica TaxID=595434 RepID=UPI001237499C|nr:hypothetical protein [Rhodopirellula islandica]